MIDQPYAAMLSRVQARKAVTLRDGDSINLTTGQVVRSSQSQIAKLLPWHEEGLRSNDLITLASTFWSLIAIADHDGSQDCGHSMTLAMSDGTCARCDAS